MMLRTTKYKFLLQQYKNRIYSYSKLLLKNKMDADDVTQEVLIRIWQNMDEFNVLKAKTWIMKTTHNLCMDYLRKRTRSYKNESSMDEEFIENFPDSDTKGNPFISMHLNSVNDRINEALRRLPENLQSVFLLYELQGMKYKEISQCLEIPINSVKVYLLRARKKLQEDLREYVKSETI
ncbi:MAG TPA: RNA polymerase sigma factor [Ignavibacteriales bacterium]|nr:RNA polymerase sigma factor [Ignavibacteriales bacterium]